MTPTGSAGLGEYIKRAFLFRWNLLAFIGGIAAGALSPWPDAMLPLVLAGEIAYLGGLISIPRFRKAIDAQVYQEAQPVRTAQGVAPSQSLAEIVNSLSQDSRRRFEALRARCLEMRTIARGVGGQSTASTEDLSTPALDKLLWIFLRLLRSQQSLDQFLRSTSVAQIQERLAQAKAKLESAPADERFRRSLQDSVAAQEMRLSNYQRASANAEFVKLESDRIEAKIQALAESSVNRQDPDTLSSQIEGVSESVQSTEVAIRELQQITGLVDQMQEPPAILEADFHRVIQ
jgi:hypothetical protein